MPAIVASGSARRVMVAAPVLDDSKVSLFALVALMVGLLLRWQFRRKRRIASLVEPVLPPVRVVKCVPEDTCAAAADAASTTADEAEFSKVKPKSILSLRAGRRPSLEIRAASTEKCMSREHLAKPPLERCRAASPEAADVPGRVHFESNVCCWHVPDLRDWSSERKARLWWQAADFAEFLRVRVEVGKAYRFVAKRRGVAVDSFFPREPALAHESRRGLGLGRKQKREQNRKNYIKAVLDEQERQRSRAAAEATDAGAEDAPFQLDYDALLRVSSKTSTQDLAESHKCAVKDYELFLREKEGVDLRAPDPVLSQTPATLTPTTLAKPKDLLLCPSDDDDFVENYSPTPAGFLLLNDELSSQAAGLDLLNLDDEPMSPTDSTSPKSFRSFISTKGFGLSRGELAKAGLSATGHKLATCEKGRHGISEDSEESANEASCEDGVSDAGWTSDASVEWVE